KKEGEAGFEKIGETGFDMTTFSDVNFNNTQTYTYRVAAQNAKGVSDYSNSVTLSLSSTDLTFIKNEVIYPNPTSGFINLPYSWSLHAKRIIIYDMQGKQLMEIENNSSLEKIDVNELQNGLYIMKICTEHMDINRKFCKE
ncbi:MAG: T9SS type A sorting domain-containing protein, partial [Bacteroidales bacterium]|nr:T9SS type A sorting domain-containing protein [Bacteroidales bacterium]